METTLNIAFIALLLKLAASFWVVVHLPIAMVVLFQLFSTDNHTLSSMDFKKAFHPNLPISIVISIKVWGYHKRVTMFHDSRG